MISFADSTDPSKIPSTFTHVAAYSDGIYAWPSAELDRFPAHIEISVLSGQPQQAQLARVLDVERLDAVPTDFPPFAAERAILGHKDPTAYTSILGDPGFGIARVLEAITAAQYSGPWRLWVAWWWERPFPPAAAEVLAEIKALTGIDLAPWRLWACQWQNGPDFDTSVLYGHDDFTR